MDSKEPSVAQSVRVLMSPGKEISNPFISLLHDNLPADVAVQTFSWRAAFLGRYDVLHVHWPDSLLVAPSRLKRVRKIVVFLALIVRNRLLGVRHVWTVHNLSPHERGGALNRFVLALWQRSCAFHVYLSSAALPAVPDRRAIVIKHGDYSSVVALQEGTMTPTSGRLLLFGLIRPYKGVEGLLRAVAALADQDLSLRITGRPVPPEYGNSIASLGADATNTEFRLERLSDADLIAEIRGAEIVVLPYTRIYNSGAALMALTAGRPIITTDSSTMRELQSEVGPEWVQILDGDTTAESIRVAVEAIRAQDRGPAPKFTGRDWVGIGDTYAKLYRTAARS